MFLQFFHYITIQWLGRSGGEIRVYIYLMGDSRSYPEFANHMMTKTCQSGPFMFVGYVRYLFYFPWILMKSYKIPWNPMNFPWNPEPFQRLRTLRWPLTTLRASTVEAALGYWECFVGWLQDACLCQMSGTLGIRVRLGIIWNRCIEATYWYLWFIGINLNWSKSWWPSDRWFVWKPHADLIKWIGDTKPSTCGSWKCALVRMCTYIQMIHIRVLFTIYVYIYTLHTYVRTYIHNIT